MQEMRELVRKRGRWDRGPTNECPVGEAGPVIRYCNTDAAALLRLTPALTGKLHLLFLQNI